MADSKYNFKRIEQKWQKRWEKERVFEAKEDINGKSKKEKFYILEMFPYSSGSGLHMGHAFNYTIGDIYARFMRMKGFNVLYPMGYDSFGLPAENAAIKSKSHPKKFTDEAISNFIKQQRALGLSYDWSRMLRTSSPEYYKWNQFFFLQFLKNGLAYRKNASVNWCPDCDSVLANEQVHNGKCWRHIDTDVEVKQLEQWFLKITKYQEELLKDLEKINWPERIKVMQKNWIGKSEGAEILFDINGKKWPVFTTRPNTLFGVTFMVISAQHPKLSEIIAKGQKKEVDNFLKKIKSTSEKDNYLLDKEGVFSGSYAINPINGERIPVWIGNFVVADYGSGIVMAVPAHDKRDFDFAKKYNIPVKIVIQPSGKKLDEKKISSAYTGSGILVNSVQFDGLNNEEAKNKIVDVLAKKNHGKKVVNFKLRDWLISRQRYWGTPIPIIYCGKCGVVPVQEKDLPVLLPNDVKFGKGNPLVTSKLFVNTKCPKCKSAARRETDTMDTFFDSSWYFLRFIDPHNSKLPFNKKLVDSWMPVDQYIGGAEHACMHLIYARFFTKALRDLGFLSFDEPFMKLFNQGMLHGSDGFVMSKSRGNVVLPEKISEKYGIDTARLFIMSIASPDKDTKWSDEGIDGSFRFVKKLINYFDDYKVVKGRINGELDHYSNKAIREVSEDIINFHYNLAIIKIREFFDKLSLESDINYVNVFVRLLSPFAPHLAEEFWEKLGNKGFACQAEWPIADEKKIDDKIEKSEQASFALISDIKNIKKITGKDKPKVYIYTIPSEVKIYEENKIAIQEASGAIVFKAFAVNDPKKHDPQNKSSKAKPGKPAIYIE